MKRSEMIKLIYDCMRDNHFGQYGEFYKMAESVLNTIEDNGMLPPCCFNMCDLKTDFQRKKFCEWMRDSNGDALANVWEPEDE